MLNSIQARLLFFIAFLLSSSVASSLIVTTWSMENSQNEQSAQSFALIEKMVQTLIHDQENRLKHQLLLVGELPIIRDVVEDGDPATVLNSAKRYREELKFSFLDILDENEELLTSVDRNYIHQENQDLIEYALDGEFQVDVRRRKDQLAIVTAVPVGVDDDPSGFLIGGIYLNNEFASKIQGLTNANISFVLENQITGSSLGIDEKDSLKDHLRELQQEVIGDPSSDFSEKQSSFKNENGEFLYRLSPLLNLTKEPVGFVVIQLSLLEHQKNIDKIQFLSSGVGVFILLVFLIAAFLFSKSIISPIVSIGEVLKEVERGDFTVQILTKSKSEIGRLERSFHNLLRKLTGVIGEIVRMASEVSQSSQDLNAFSSQISSSSESVKDQSLTIAGSTQKMTQNMKELSSSSTEVSQNVNTISSSVKELSHNINNVADSAAVTSMEMGEISEQISTISSKINQISHSAEVISVNMEQIAQESKKSIEIYTLADQRVRDTLKTISFLEESAHEIGRTTRFIDNIAHQTNMLALNAMIEASAAGQAGHGFTVVANEVKLLSQKTTEANQLILKKIEQIRKFTAESREHANKINQTIQDGTQVTERIFASIVRENQMSSQLSESVDAIATSSEVASVSVSSASLRLKDISQSTVQASQAAKESAQNINNAAGEVDNISTLIQQFSEGIKHVDQNVHKIQRSIDEVNNGVRRTREKSRDLSKISSSQSDLVAFFKLKEDYEFEKEDYDVDREDYESREDTKTH